MGRSVSTTVGCSYMEPAAGGEEDLLWACRRTRDKQGISGEISLEFAPNDQIMNKNPQSEHFLKMHPSFSSHPKMFCFTVHFIQNGFGKWCHLQKTKTGLLCSLWGRVKNLRPFANYENIVGRQKNAEKERNMPSIFWDMEGIFSPPLLKFTSTKTKKEKQRD